MRMYVATLLLAASTACAYQNPVAPTPVAVAAPTARTPMQLAIVITGPDTWWTDRLLGTVHVFDQNGAEVGAVVECDSSDGAFVPRQFNTSSRGAEIIGVKIGSQLVCRAGNVQASYSVTALDWRVLGGGSGPTPALPALPAPAPGSGKS
jgi:hypothetical protein